MQRTKWTMDERESSSSSSSSARPRAFGFSGIDVRTNPDVKNVKREFSSLFDAYLPDDDGDDAVTTLAYFGNVDVGRDVSLSALRSTHDVVILAYGTQSSDRRQGIPGSGDGELDGMLSAREFVVWYNGQYSTSLWPLLVLAYQKVVETDAERARLETALVVLFAINSTYSLAWDIIMDWGMMQNPLIMVPESCAGGGIGGAPISSGGSKTPDSCAHLVLRPRLRFGVVTSVAILFIDTVLRYCWVLRFYEKNLFPNIDVYILCTQFLEAVR
jgi:hypothetical protein